MNGNKLLDIAAIGIVALAALACGLPFLLVVSGSLSSESEIIARGYSIWPRSPSFAAYRTIFEQLEYSIFDAYKVSIFVTVLGTSLGLLTTSMSGYVLSRPDFKHRNRVAFFVYLTTLFNGGMIPTYLVIANVLQLNHTLWAIILPGIMTPFNVFVFLNFIKNIPQSLVESARIDGAGEFRIYWRVIVPLSVPAMATVGLFLALGYWNNWFGYSLYLISDSNKWGLQYLLYRMMSQTSAAVRDSHLAAAQMPSETIKLAMTVLAAGPMLLFYPYAQRYFAQGLVVGSVKN